MLGSREQAPWLLEALWTTSLLSAQVDEDGALMAAREVLNGMGWSLPWSDRPLPPS